MHAEAAYPPLTQPIYGIIGVGAIAAAIVDGLCADGDSPDIRLSPRNAATAAALAGRHPSVSICADNQAVLAEASIILLCVRPQDAASVLTDLTFRPDQAVISVMAGIPIEQLASLVAPATDICRTIPLPSVATRASVTPLVPPNPVACAIFDRLGGALELEDEARFEAFSAATGTVAAYFSYLDAISGWLSARGIPPGDADRYVASVFASLGDSLSSERNLSALGHEHTTPGGINELFNRHLHEAGLIDAVHSGLDSVLDRLSGQNRVR
jgi:pyrroline-5-carboxylate reductase